VVEDPKFRDEYTFVKREAGFRMFTVMNTVVDLVSALIGIIVAGLVIVKFSVVYGVVMLGVMCLRFVGIDKAVKKSVTALQTSAKYNRLWEIYEGFLESAKSSYETRILGIKGMVKKQINEIMEKTVGLYGDTERSLLPQRVIQAILPMLAVLAIGYHSFLWVLGGLISLGDWQLLFSTSMTFLNKFRDFADSIATAKESGAYVSSLMSLYAWNKQVADTGRKYEISKITSLEFKNVSFKYPNSENYALKNVNFVIKENENVAIVGINGAGKTTLVKLLCKFYEPTEGEILINGENIKEFSKESYWKCLSALFQDFERYPMSARESIGYGDITKINDMAEITKSAKLMGMDEYFQSLPKGYDTPLIRDLEGGTDLSTGQWQKTALSRALFRQSQIIILDEPTSNIDPQSEEEIFEKLIDVVKSRIMLLISHRFSTVKKANHILVINKGELVEEGSHKELMSKKGMYARLFKIQAKSYVV
jgi:ABC-type multidrug transport system fused ATPase/permease subunit